MKCMENIPKRKKCVMWLYTILSMSYLVIETRGAYLHWVEKIDVWEPHAMLHAIQGTFYTQALCILVVVITWIPFRRGEYWGWLTAGCIGIVLHGSHVIGDAMSHGGLRNAEAAQGSGAFFYAGTVTILLLYIAGFILSKPFFTRPQCCHKQESDQQ